MGVSEQEFLEEKAKEPDYSDSRVIYWQSLLANLLNACPVDTGNMKAHIIAWETPTQYAIAIAAPYKTNPKVGVDEINGFTDYALEVNTINPRHIGWVNRQIRQTASQMGFESVMSKEDKLELGKLKENIKEESKMIRAFNMRKRVYKDNIKSVRKSPALNQGEKAVRIAKINNLIAEVDTTRKPYETRRQIYKTRVEEITKRYDIPKKPKSKKGK